MKFFHRKNPPKGWFPEEPIRHEMKNIQSMNLDFNSKNEKMQELVAKVKSIKTIKTIEIYRLLPKFWKFNLFNPFRIKIIPRTGQLATTIGGEAGSTQSMHISTGFANYFYHNEYYELSAKVRSDTSPRFSAQFTHDYLEEADYSLLQHFFTTYSVSASYDMKMFKKQKITTAMLSSTYHPKNSFLSHSASLSIVKEDQSETVPPAFYCDPSPYVKMALKTENTSIIIPSAGAFCELSYLFSKSKQNDKLLSFIPALKVQTNISKFIDSLNLKFSGSGGCIIAPEAVPFNEKFKVGGAPIARGIENHEFGPTFANFPSGIDAFASSTIEFFTPLFPQVNLNAHFFVNGAIGANFKSNNFFDNLPDYSSVLTFGTGLVFRQGGIQVELNTQIPYYFSEGLKTVKYQIGFSPV